MNNSKVKEIILDTLCGLLWLAVPVGIIYACIKGYEVIEWIAGIAIVLLIAWGWGSYVRNFTIGSPTIKIKSKKETEEK